LPLEFHAQCSEASRDGIRKLWASDKGIVNSRAKKTIARINSVGECRSELSPHYVVDGGRRYSGLCRSESVREVLHCRRGWGWEDEVVMRSETDNWLFTIKWNGSELIGFTSV
jgi:hypothetical protein